MHRYQTHLRWTGNLGSGTDTYRAYSRDHVVEIAGKPPLPGSADAVFRGDPARHTPEDLLLAALSACHMLAYLHLCADRGVVVETYEDDATATMDDRFREAVLRPRVRLSAGDPQLAQSLHDEAHHQCFIANSVNFPVRCEPEIIS